MQASSRIERRRAERETRILRIAALRFAQHGIDGVRLDEIADEADMARATFYTHFKTKDALVAAIVRPALEQADREGAGLRERAPRAAVRELIELYARLWHAHPDAMTVGHGAARALPSECAQLHASFMVHVLRVLERAGRAALLRSGDAALSARILARLAVPMLQLYAGHPRQRALFLESMEGLLLKADAEKAPR